MIAAARTVRIDVTAEDLADGIPCDARDCAVARAAARALPLCDAPVVVSTSFLSFGPWDARQTIRLPEYVGDWIAAFDAGVAREPIAFELEVSLD